MRTITIDIINEKVIGLLKNLELLELIRVRSSSKGESADEVNWAKYKGAMSQQSLVDIEDQLAKLRDEWG